MLLSRATCMMVSGDGRWRKPYLRLRKSWPRRRCIKMAYSIRMSRAWHLYRLSIRHTRCGLALCSFAPWRVSCNHQVGPFPALPLGPTNLSLYLFWPRKKEGEQSYTCKCEIVHWQCHFNISRRRTNYIWKKNSNLKSNKIKFVFFCLCPRILAVVSVTYYRMTFLTREYVGHKTLIQWPT